MCTMGPSGPTVRPLEQPSSVPRTLTMSVRSCNNSGICVGCALVGEAGVKDGDTQAAAQARVQALLCVLHACVRAYVVAIQVGHDEADTDSCSSGRPKLHHECSHEHAEQANAHEPCKCEPDGSCVTHGAACQDGLHACVLDVKQKVHDASEGNRHHTNHKAGEHGDKELGQCVSRVPGVSRPCGHVARDPCTTQLHTPVKPSLALFTIVRCRLHALLLLLVIQTFRNAHWTRGLQQRS